MSATISNCFECGQYIKPIHVILKATLNSKIKIVKNLTSFFLSCFLSLLLMHGKNLENKHKSKKEINKMLFELNSLMEKERLCIRTERITLVILIELRSQSKKFWQSLPWKLDLANLQRDTASTTQLKTPNHTHLTPQLPPNNSSFNPQLHNNRNIN